jgi:hypothetical protein
MTDRTEGGEKSLKKFGTGDICIEEGGARGGYWNHTLRKGSTNQKRGSSQRV